MARRDRNATKENLTPGYEGHVTDDIEAVMPTDRLQANISLISPENKELPALPSKVFHRGWRFGVMCGLFGTAFAFLCNITLLLWTSHRPRTSANNWVMFVGSCTTTQNIDTWSHLAINVLSTMILGSSNYASQILAAPTRTDINAAHAQHRNVDIAVLSYKNLLSIPYMKRLSLIILFTTSLPLHLLYNSIILSSESTVQQSVTIVSSDFLEHDPTQAPWNEGWRCCYVHERTDLENGGYFTLDWTSQCEEQPSTTHYCHTGYSEYHAIKIEGIRTKESIDRLWHDAVEGSLSSINANDCGLILAANSKSDYSDIIVFADYQSSITQPDNYQSLLGGQLTTHVGYRKGFHVLDIHHLEVSIYENQNMSQVYNEYLAAKSCLVRQGHRECTVELIPGLLIAVIICNFLKGIIFAHILFSHVISAPLLVLGDAIASFLDHPDAQTCGRGGLSASDIRSRLPKPKRPTNDGQEIRCTGWQSPSRHYAHSISSFRWMLFLQMGLGSCTTGLSLLTTDHFLDPESSFTELWQAGFKSVQTINTLELAPSNDPDSVLIRNLVIANIPQLALSLIYTIYNSVITCLCVSSEWAGYADKGRKRGLRVTNPAGQQRSSYWLSLPLKISIPLMITSVTLHWLMSQTLYILRFNFFTPDGQKVTDPKSNIRPLNGIAWSPLMLSICLGVLALMILALLIFSLMKFPPGTPIVSSNSWAISANCRAIRPGESLQKLQFGVIEDLPDGKYRVGFSSGDVRPLVPGEHYE